VNTTLSERTLMEPQTFLHAHLGKVLADWLKCWLA